MTEVIKYVAKDGTEFVDKKACLCYEHNQAFEGGISDGYRMFDNEMNPISAIDFERSMYVEINTDEAAITLYEFLEENFPNYEKLSPPAMKGRWVYITEEWFNYDYLHEVVQAVDKAIKI